MSGVGLSQAHLTSDGKRLKQQGRGLRLDFDGRGYLWQVHGPSDRLRNLRFIFIREFYVVESGEVREFDKRLAWGNSTGSLERKAR